MKTCSRCNVGRTDNEYGKRLGRKYGTNSWCKPCRAASTKAWRDNLSPEKRREMCRRENLSRHGITPQEFDEMLSQQDGCCAICGGISAGGGNDRGNMHVDHCHESGKIRGLLCHSCNTGLGLFRDDPSTLRQAIESLELNEVAALAI